jgi:putative two-component system response regulator
MHGERKKIIVVDDNLADLASAKNILSGKYTVYPARSAEEMFNLLADRATDMILLDVGLPGQNGHDALRKMREDARWDNIPVICVTDKCDEDWETAGASLGAADYIVKPFSEALLLKRVEDQLTIAEQYVRLREFSENLEDLVRDKTHEVVELQSAIISSVAELIEFRDDVTGGHASRTQRYLALLIEEMQREHIYIDELNKWDMQNLLPSAQLHDVGKIAISDNILKKPGRLTAEEFEIMKTHAAVGVEAIDRIQQNPQNSAFLVHARLIAGSHHEWWDGSGYPDGLRGRDIPLQGRIMAIADVYDALISVRPYKSAIPTDEAREIIAAGSGTHFDPTLVRVFLNVADKFAQVVEEFHRATDTK